jgi:CubicO group peptidase (beta-lactamase class C family)
MRRMRSVGLALGLAAMTPVFLQTLGAGSGSVPSGKPEDAGMSHERLKRVSEVVQRRIDAKDVAGAVTLVASRGKVVEFEAQGMADLESRRPMARDAIFRLASMTKPITGVAVMMMVEEGRVHLTDPVSRFIPEFKNLNKVAVASTTAKYDVVGRGLPAVCANAFERWRVDRQTPAELEDHSADDVEPHR